MSPLIAGEYVPRRLRVAMAATRMANAIWARQNALSFRYILDVNIHEALDPDCEILVKDTLVDTVIGVPDLLKELPHYERNLVERA